MGHNRATTQTASPLSYGHFASYQSIQSTLSLYIPFPIHSIHKPRYSCCLYASGSRLGVPGIFSPELNDFKPLLNFAIFSSRSNTTMTPFLNFECSRSSPVKIIRLLEEANGFVLHRHRRDLSLLLHQFERVISMKAFVMPIGSITPAYLRRVPLLSADSGEWTWDASTEGRVQQHNLKRTTHFLHVLHSHETPSSRHAACSRESQLQGPRNSDRHVENGGSRMRRALPVLPNSNPA